MENKKLCMGISVLVLIFGMMFVGCDNNTTDENGKVGTFVLTDIPEVYNGKYAHCELNAENNTYYINSDFGQIVNGKASLSLRSYSSANIMNVGPYFGNHTVLVDGKPGNYSLIGIYNTPSFDNPTRIASVVFNSPITFSNGNVTISVNMGEIINE